MGFQAASSANGTFDKGDTITNGATLANGTSHSYGSSGTNSTTQVNSVSRGDIPTPIAICGMALRLPGALSSPEELWDFLLNKGDGRCRVPETRYNVNAYHSTSKRPGTVASKYGYFLDESVRLGCLDTNRFSLTRAELELADPQHRLMLEVTREALDDAGETNFKGKSVGCYIGSYAEDWLEMQTKDHQSSGGHLVDGYSDFMLSNRVSYEMDLKGPSMTIRTACSSSLICLHEACLAIQQGHCDSAIVGGSNLIMAPGLTSFMSQKGVLSPEGSCKSFSADADGYARGEGILAIFIKPLEAAIRDGNPIRAVIRSTIANSDGKTQGIAQPNGKSHEAMIRKAYELAGITDYSKTAFVECHGTGTSVGDPIEASAVARVFGGDHGMHITSIKPNMGHSEGASGLSSLVKAVMALENRTIPPNIKFSAPNPKIPFKEFNITVPVEPTPFPAGRDRVSVNSFGLGGSNAHVVLDSARSFNLPPRARSSYPPSSPQLLLFSAASSPSLQKITSDFQKWVANNPDSLVDAAYTLANKREHFQHRSFLVVSPDVDGVVSQSKKVPNQTPSLVMIFTGQGAQWPRMGRELLLRKDLGFQSTIRELDKYLRVVPNAPEWTLEEELLKPAKTSRVQLAELSQPLCTAVQVALVDMLATVGVYPTAVVGHSSGELAAAYAAGALTAREAIISAFERGRAATNQTRKGAMAAVGLGWDDVNRYLDSDKVVVACENSPRSVTLSGDAPDVEATVARIKKAHPDITARLLKVEKAYHSYHMREIGDQYLATIKPHVESNIPQKLFFSSVTGSGKPHKDVLGAKYWQQNLESPVLFKSAVSGILDYIKNPAFLEIGPHGALAGPVRQILAQTSATAPYISAMSRGEDTVSSFLSAIGKLFELNVSIDFAALMPSGTTLASLPRYQWDHEVEYWRESRISSEWRGRKHPMHPLLGLRVLESTSLEPAFRNNLNLQHVSWLRDHKIEGNVIFPGAGYVAMAGEGIRQITGVENSYTIRHMVLSSALVVPEGTETEILTTFHPHRLTDSLDSKWWEFTVASHNGQVWTKHCSGQVTAGPAEPAAHKEEALLPRKVVAKKLYDVLDGAGIEYGDHFMRLRDIRTGTIERRSTATLAQDTTDDDDYFHLHPSVIDACLQTGPLAATCGRIDAKETRRVPTKLEEITVHRVAVGVDISASSSAVVAPGGGEVVGHLTCIADGKIVLEMQGATLSRLEEAAVIDTERLPITARLTWGPHIDFVDAGKLIRPEVPRHLYTPSLDELGRLCMVYTQRRIQDARALTETPHMQKYMAWISRQAAACDTSITGQTDVDIKDAVANLVSRLSSTPVASCADTLQKIFNNIDGLLSGEIDPLELLLADDTLTKIYVAIDAVDRSEFIKYMAHSRPNLRILEIGAGTGGSTAAILKDLVLPIGQPLYSKYTYTDISSGFFVAAKERFKSYRNIEYRALDISKNPAEQDMEGEKYDLILASNVLHATKSLQETLRNVRSLLAPNGRLLLQEMNSPSKWPNYIFGTLAGWWYGEPDGRPEEPYVTPARWESELKRAGFQGLDTVVLDGEEPHQLNSMIVAKPQNTETSNAKKTVTLLCDDGESQAAMLSKQLENRGYTVYQCQLGERLPPGQDVIALLDGGRPFFKDIQESRLKAFQGVLDNLGDSAMLWITRLSQMHCNDPQYAQIIGAARTIRNESLIDLATCEVDDIPSSLHKIIDVFARFQTRSEDEALKPDYEYAIVNGTVNTGRIYPFSLDQELLSKPDEQSSVILDVGKLGRLNTMQWIPRQARGLTGDEVEIEVHATGLNFKDVLGALAIVPYPEEGLGAEAAGVVARVGPGVKNLRIGDRVMLLAYGCFASHVVASERACATIPDDLTFDDAGSMPAIFTTAIAGLLKIGDLRKGQTVLIHSACGGVGLAAIQLAKMVGAEIFATVGSEEKVKYLTKVIGIPRNRIFNSRDDSFVADIMRETNGIGVDIALNSLSGELLHATWRCIAEFGKMVDIGKRDFLGAGKLDMNVFLGSRTYACFYLDRLLDVRKDSVQELMQTMSKLLKMGQIAPITPKRVYNASEIEDAFRFMQQGQHLGKIVISVRDSNSTMSLDMAAVTNAQKLKLRSDASYLLIGGLGGLGRSVARHLVEHGARRIVFLSRSAGSGAEDSDTVQELESMDCEVRLVKGSVINKDDVIHAIQQAPNLKGILQLAMVLRDQNFIRMTHGEWTGACTPKIEGSWNLHNATVEFGISLDFFVLYSSLSGTTGQPGQANYAAASTFLDSFAQYRNNLGLAASVIDIGAVQEVGYVSQDEALRQRMSYAHSITERELLEAVSAAIVFSPRNPVETSGDAKFTHKNTIAIGLNTTVPLSSPDCRAIWKKDSRMAVYHNSSKSSATKSGSGGELQSFVSSAKNDPSILKKDDTVAFLATEIGKKLFSFLLRSDEDLDISMPLSQLGMDSLVGVEMRGWWRQAFAFDISVLELLGAGNLEGLGQHAAEGLLKLLGEVSS